MSPALDVRALRAIRQREWAAKFSHLLAATAGAIETVGTDPGTVEAAIAAVAAARRMPAIFWDCAEGFRVADARSDDEDDVRAAAAAAAVLAAEVDRLGKDLGSPGLLTPLEALKAIERMRLAPFAASPAGDPAPCLTTVFVLANFYPFFRLPDVAQYFESLCKQNRLNFADADNALHYRPIYFVQAPHEALDIKGLTTVRHWITPHPFPMPDEEEFRADVVAPAIEAAGAAGVAAVGDEPYFRGVAAALRGLDRRRGKDVLHYALAASRGFSPAVPGIIRREAARLIAGATAVEVVPAADLLRPEDLGGVANAMRALERAARSYTDAARAQGLDPTAGIYATGLPGTGKSSLAKVAASVFERTTGRAFTTLRVRVGDLFGGVVGDTERNWHEAERVIGAFGPDTVVWFDEFEKAFGHGGEGGGDSGVARRLFGAVLEWLADPSRQCYVLAAMNDPQSIPPEVFRRFDAGFFFGMPRKAARVDVLKIHLARRLARTGHALADLGLDDAAWGRLGDASSRFLPSELEAVVKAARDAAFLARGEAVPTLAELLAVIEDRAPRVLAVQRKDDLEELRARCRAEPADDEEPAAAAGAGPARTRGLTIDAAP